MFATTKRLQQPARGNMMQPKACQDLSLCAHSVICDRQICGDHDPDHRLDSPCTPCSQQALIACWFANSRQGKPAQTSMQYRGLAHLDTAASMPGKRQLAAFPLPSLACSKTLAESWTTEHRDFGNGKAYISWVMTACHSLSRLQAKRVCHCHNACQ